MSIASTNKDIIRIKEQIKQLSAGIPVFDGSSFSQVGHTHSINDISALTATLAGKQDTLIAGDNITIVDNRISSTGGGGTSIWTDGASVIYLNTGEKSVGIGGTTAPKFFSIHGNAYIYSDLTMVNGNNGYSTTKNQFVFGYNGGQSYRHCIKTRHEATAIPKKNAIDFYIWTSGQTFDAIGDTHGMSITAAGVGIGKIEPQYKLDVDGDINLTGNLLVGGTNKLQFLDATSTIQGQLSGKAASIHTHAINDITNLTTTLSNKQDKLIAGTNINFVGNTINSIGASQWTSGSGGIINYNGGNVGIGTDTPLGKLEVIGNMVLQNTNTWQTVFQMYNNDKSKNCSFNFGGTANTVIGNGGLGIFMNNDFRITIKDDGNVGIGKTNPQRKFEVSNSTQGSISIYGSGDVRYHCYNSGGQAEWLWGQKSSTNHNWTLSKLVGTTETDVLAVSISGGVGIGTSNPSSALDVVGLVKSTVGFQHGNNLLKNITYTTADIVLVNDYYYMFNSTYFMNNGLRGTVLYSAISSTNHRNNGMIFIDSAYNIIEHIRWMYNNGLDVDVISGDLKLKNATGGLGTFQMTFTLLG